MGAVAQCLVLLGLVICIVAVCGGLYYGYHLLSKHHKLISIAVKKCDEYAKNACNLGLHVLASGSDIVDDEEDEVAKLIGGKQAKLGQFPHMALLSIAGEICSGSLISDEFVLTTVNCVHDAKKEQVSVKLGSTSRTQNGTAKWFNVSEIIVHPDWSKTPKGAYYNDIALLKLSERVIFSHNIRPICLGAYVGFKKDITTAAVAGWGFDYSGQYSENLLQLDAVLGIGVQSECENKWGNLFDYYSTMLCAGHPKTNKGLCKGDFGGPLMIPVDSIVSSCSVYFYELLGIASVGNHDCKPNDTNETYVVAYTRVERFIPWIVTNVWP